MASFVLAVIPLLALAQDPQKQEPFVFDWPVPGKVAVTEIARRKGKSVKMRYRLDITRMKGSTDIRVHYSDFELLEFDNRPLTSEMKPAMEPIKAIFSARPDLRISEAGEAKDVIGVDRNIDIFYERLAEVREYFGRKTDPEEDDAARAAMKKPEVKALMRDYFLEPWEMWVGVWVGLELSAGEVLEADVDVPLSIGTEPIRHHSVMANQGTVDGHPGMVKLALEITRGGEKSRDAIIGELSEFLAKTPGGAPDFDDLKNFEQEQKAYVITDPRTLRPRKAVWEKKTKMTVEGRGDVTSVESHDYTFAW